MAGGCWVVVWGGFRGCLIVFCVFLGASGVWVVVFGGCGCLALCGILGFDVLLGFAILCGVGII